MAATRARDTQDKAITATTALEEFIDREIEEFCAREGDDAVTLDEVLRATASIPGSMAEAIIEEERADRF